MRLYCIVKLVPFAFFCGGRLPWVICERGVVLEIHSVYITVWFLLWTGEQAGQKQKTPTALFQEQLSADGLAIAQ